MAVQSEHTVMQTLQSTGLFDGIPLTIISEFASTVRIAHYERQEVIVPQGASNCGLYIVAEGLVKEYRLHTSGRQRVIKMYGSGSLFGRTILTDSGSCILQAEAVEPTEVYVIIPRYLQSLIEQDATVAIRLMIHMAKQLEEAYLELESVAYEPIYHRVCNLLIKLCNDLQISVPSGCFISLRITQEDMAEMLGVTRMTVTKAVRELRKKGILLGRSGNLRLDHDALSEETKRFSNTFAKIEPS
jgi:CRP/FNR family transcriptional regulator, cyclic AMP receptor protein